MIHILKITCYRFAIIYHMFKDVPFCMSDTLPLTQDSFCLSKHSEIYQHSGPDQTNNFNTDKVKLDMVVNIGLNSYIIH